jgi:hypothetical protein
MSIASTGAFELFGIGEINEPMELAPDAPA